MDLINRDACDILDLLTSGEVSPIDLIDAAEARYAEVDSMVNAVPITCFERARQQAELIMEKPMAERGMLKGLPVMIKDLTNVAGVQSTMGSPIFKDAVPEQSDDVVLKLEESGGIVTGKSNTPEFGAGANTFNDLFGATVNPWNTTLSAAGSSGGAAVALATGMAWLAQGSDLGGSLRNPASFNGIVGMRPSPGCVPSTPSNNPFDTLPVDGPMARSIRDVGLMLEAMSGHVSTNPLSLGPLSLDHNHTSFMAASRKAIKPKKVAWSADLGITVVDPEVEALCRAAVQKFADEGVEVVEAHPDFSNAHKAFQVLRAHGFASSLFQLYEDHRDLLKPEVIWNIEVGLKLTGAEIAEAERMRGQIFQNAAQFMHEVDLILTPATIVPPYPVENRYVTECNGVTFETYIDWLAIAYAITLTSLPALSLPCGMTASELPCGLQMVGRLRDEAGLLSHAQWAEQVLGRMSTPITPKTD